MDVREMPGDPSVHAPAQTLVQEVVPGRNLPEAPLADAGGTAVTPARETNRP